MFEQIIGRFWTPLVLRWKLGALGRKPRTAGFVRINGGVHIRIGDDFFCGRNLYISTSQYCAVTVGNAVMFGPDVMILGGDHDFSFHEQHMRYNSRANAHSRDIVVEDGAWVGARTMILSGAHVGEGAVIGAAAVVRGSVPPYAVAVGSQLRVIKCRFQSVSELATALKNLSSKYTVEMILEQYERCGIRLDLKA